MIFIVKHKRHDASMVAQILPLPGVKAPSDSVGYFVRLGDTGHRQLSDLHAEGRFSPRRIVVDASRLKHQKELVEALKSSGARIILDTKAAELSAKAKFAGFASGAPWAVFTRGRPLSPDQFGQNSRDDIIGQMARFAVEHRVHTVLSPSHFLREGTRSEWFNIDRQSCILLRQALDAEGGRDISIDYSLLMPHLQLDEVEERGQIVGALRDLPFDNLWLRASGFGADARPLTTRKYIGSLSAMHNVGKPIVADYLGGLVALAAVSFGVISGFAEGTGGERERFDAREWHKPAKVLDEDKQFGRTTRIAIAGFGRSVSISELQMLHDAKGGRRLVACNDRNCCLHGFSDMIANPRRHGIFQRDSQIRDIEQIPNLNRSQYFLDGEMTRADRLARQIKDLKTGDEPLTNRMAMHSHRIEKMRSTLEYFHEVRGVDFPQAGALVERHGPDEHRGIR